LPWALSKGFLNQVQADDLLTNESSSSTVQFREVTAENVIVNEETSSSGVAPKSPLHDSAGPPSPVPVQQRETQLKRLQAVVVKAANISKEG